MLYFKFFVDIILSLFIKKFRGLDNAGKSSILNWWLHSPLNSEKIPSTLNKSISPTFGFEIKSIITTEFESNSKKIPSCRLNFWDIGGQRSIRPFWRNYYEETDAIVWVIDSTDINRMNDCKSELENILNEDVMQQIKRQYP